MSTRRGVRILGPYEQHNGFRIVEVACNGDRESTLFATAARAQRYKELLEAALEREEHTTETAFEHYKRHLQDKGTKSESIDVTTWAIAQFFPEPLPVQLLTPGRCAKLYEDLRTRPSKRTKKPFAADTHRNVLAQTKSFLAWCATRGWLRGNPLVDVKGIGKRRPRGKSLGKSGNTLRVREARAWYVKALALATLADARADTPAKLLAARQQREGATAALVAMLLGMRASEITSRRVADLDEDAAPGDLLWIPCSKTPAGRRTLEVPDVLRPLLVACCEGKDRESYVFEAEAGKPHWRDWIISNVRRICGLAEVPKVTAHAMRGLLATLTAERGLAGHLIAATLGHDDERTTMRAYAAPGSAAAGVNRRGLVVLNGGAGAVERRERLP